MKNKVSINLNISLLEIILSVLIFAAAGMIMLNCFAIARFTQERANDKAAAGAIIQSDFEIIKSLKTLDEVHEFLKDAYETRSIDENNHVYTKYYDKGWNESNNNEYSVTLSLREEELKSGHLIEINISAKKERPYPFIKKEGQEEIYKIDSRKFFPLSGGSYGK